MPTPTIACELAGGRTAMPTRFNTFFTQTVTGIMASHYNPRPFLRTSLRRVNVTTSLTMEVAAD